MPAIRPTESIIPRCAASPPRPGSRHSFTSSTCSRLLLANRSRFSSLGSVCVNRYSVRRDRFLAFPSQVPSVDFCNTHRRADTPKRAFNPRPNERPRSLGSFHHRHADDGDKPTPRSTFACATWAGSARAKGSRSELPSSIASPEHPGRRSALQSGVETPSLRNETAKILFRRRPAKGNGFQRTKVLSTELESTRANQGSR